MLAFPINDASRCARVCGPLRRPRRDELSPSSGGGSRLLAHRSSAPVYDRDSIVEAEGEIVEMSWVNPHVRFKLRGLETGGRERI